MIDLLRVQDTPYLSRRNYLCEMRHILLWGVVAAMVEGRFASIVVANTFGGGAVLINIAATTPVAAHLTSLFWGTLCIGRAKVRLMTVATSGVVLATTAVAMTPDEGWGAWLFVVQMAAAQFFMTGTTTVRAALWKSNYPGYARGRISARLQVARAVAQLTAVALAAWALGAYPEFYRVYYLFVGGVGVVAIVVLQRLNVRGERRELADIRDRAGEDSDALVAPVRLRGMLSPRNLLGNAVRVLRADVRFRHYCAAQMCSGMANLMVHSVVVAIIVQDLLGAAPAAFWLSAVLIEVLPKALLIATMGRFAGYFDRVGVVRFRVVHGACWALTILLGMLGTLAVTYAEAIGPYYFLLAVGLFALFGIVRGVCFGGGAIAWNLGHLHFAKSADAEVYMGIHVSLTGLRGLLLPTVGMVLWHAIGWRVWIVSLAFSLLSLLLFWFLARAEAANAAAGGGSRPSGEVR